MTAHVGSGEGGQPRVEALFEAHLTVVDLTRSVAFYRDVVGLQPAFEVPERRASFRWVGAPGRSMLGLWEVGSAPIGVRSHIAFRLRLSDLFAAVNALRERGVTPRAFDGSETTEPSVLAWMPAAALYFDDPDGHWLEFLSVIDAAPRRSLGVVPYGRWLAET